MFKKFLALAFVLASGAAMAGGFGGVEYNYVDGVGDSRGLTTNGYTITLGTNVAPNTAVDLKTSFVRADNSGATGNALEAGVTQSYGLGNGLSAYARVGLGKLWTNGSDLTYYSVEPGLKYAATQDLTLSAAYRFRDSTSADRQFKTNTLRLGGEYALTKASAVTFGYDRYYGDTQANGVNVGYAFKF